MVVGGWLCELYGGVVVVGLCDCGGDGGYVVGVVVWYFCWDVVGVDYWLVLGVWGDVVD